MNYLLRILSKLVCCFYVVCLFSSLLSGLFIVIYLIELPASKSSFVGETKHNSPSFVSAIRIIPCDSTPLIFLGAKFNKEDHKIVDHYTYAIVSDGDLMEGISHESASMAGHMGLGKLIYLSSLDDWGLQ